jgi:hypothetical protein
MKRPHAGNQTDWSAKDQSLWRGWNDESHEPKERIIGPLLSGCIVGRRLGAKSSNGDPKSSPSVAD